MITSYLGQGRLLTELEKRVLWVVALGTLRYDGNNFLLGDEVITNELNTLTWLGMIYTDGLWSYALTENGENFL